MFHVEVVGETKLTVSLGASIQCKCLLTHDKWHVLLQSENVFELGGKNIRFAMFGDSVNSFANVSFSLQAVHALIEKSIKSTFNGFLYFWLHRLLLLYVIKQLFFFLKSRWIAAEYLPRFRRIIVKYLFGCCRSLIAFTRMWKRTPSYIALSIL